MIIVDWDMFKYILIKCNRSIIPGNYQLKWGQFTV